MSLYKPPSKRVLGEDKISDWGLNRSPGGQMEGTGRTFESSPRWKSRTSAPIFCSKFILFFSSVWVSICCCNKTESANFLWHTRHCGNRRIGGFERWTPMWVFKLLFPPKLWSQKLHLCAFFFSCTNAICLSKLPFCLKRVSQIVRVLVCECACVRHTRACGNPGAKEVRSFMKLLRANVRAFRVF